MMILKEQSRIDVSNGIGLRSELAIRSLNLASTRAYFHERTDGHVPGIVFGRDERGRHGNFHPDAYEMICANPAWAKRLDKVHTASRRMRIRSNWQWKELDCSSSFDALLMNIFCPSQGVRGNKSPEPVEQGEGCRAGVWVQAKRPASEV